METNHKSAATAVGKQEKIFEFLHKYAFVFLRINVFPQKTISFQSRK